MGLSKLHEELYLILKNRRPLKGLRQVTFYFRMLTPLAGWEDGRTQARQQGLDAKKDNVFAHGCVPQFIHLHQRLAGPRGGLPAHQALPHASFSGKVSSLWLPIATPVAKCPRHPLFQACHKMGLKGV